MDGRNIAENDANGIVNGIHSMINDISVKVGDKNIYDCNSRVLRLDQSNYYAYFYLRGRICPMSMKVFLSVLLLICQNI